LILFSLFPLPRAVSVLFCHQVTRHTIYISARPHRHAPAHANCVTKRFIIAVVPSKVGDERTSHGTPTGEIAMAAGARLRSCSAEKPRGTGTVPPGIASGWSLYEIELKVIGAFRTRMVKL